MCVSIFPIIIKNVIIIEISLDEKNIRFYYKYIDDTFLLMGYSEINCINIDYDTFYETHVYIFEKKYIQLFKKIGIPMFQFSISNKTRLKNLKEYKKCNKLIRNHFMELLQE
jgi:hypothetical protein